MKLADLDRNWIAPVGFGAAELEKRGQLAEGNCKASMAPSTLV